MDFDFDHAQLSVQNLLRPEGRLGLSKANLARQYAAAELMAMAEARASAEAETTEQAVSAFLASVQAAEEKLARFRANFRVLSGMAVYGQGNFFEGDRRPFRWVEGRAPCYYGWPDSNTEAATLHALAQEYNEEIVVLTGYDPDDEITQVLFKYLSL